MSNESLQDDPPAGALMTPLTGPPPHPSEAFGIGYGIPFPVEVTAAQTPGRTPYRGSTATARYSAGMRTPSASPALAPNDHGRPSPFLTPLGESPDKSKAGLRELAQEVLARVREKGTTTYAEVANHLIEGLNREEEQKLSDGKVKNIRRRVYDALNVLLAIGVIAKEKKRIRWVGFPDGTESKEEARLLQEKTDLLEAIKQSQAELDEIRNQIKIYHTLISRNELINPHEPSIQPSLLFFPFLTLTTPQKEISISIDDDYTQYWLDVPCHFEIRDDSEVLGLIHKRIHRDPDDHSTL